MCINPIQVEVKGRKNNFIMTDCRYCLNCLVKKQSQLTFLAQKEQLMQYRKGNGCSFVTLTYSDDYLPINEQGFVTLKLKDVQDFLKRVRRNMEYHNEKKEFKVVYCGEYGDGSHSTSKSGISTNRPHYHIAFLGLSDTEVVKYTRKLWKFGLCDIGVLTSGGLRYICKYMSKACPSKEVKAIREAAEVENPFIKHSIGLGKQWIIENVQKIADNGYTFNLNGKINFFPKYVCQFVQFRTGVNYRVAYKEYLMKYELPKSKATNIQYNQYAFEKSYVQYIQKVSVLRQQNKPVDDITLSKKWIHPYHFIDRVNISKMVDTALSV